MRSIGLIVITLVILALLFLGFLWMQPPTGQQVSGPKTEGPTTSMRPQVGEAGGESIIGQGTGVWVQTFDKDTARLLHEFRAERYDPPKNGLVHVLKPEARFYMSDGSVTTLAAEDGQVVMPEPAKKDPRLQSLQAQQPQRGTLNKVHVTVTEPGNRDNIVLTCDLPILAFDNDTLRMNTVDTQIDGKDVLADQVPIFVRGKYEFDGSGLQVQWNQRDQRLEYLKVAHGNRLRVNDASMFGPVGLMAPGTGEAPQFVDASDVAVREQIAQEATATTSPSFIPAVPATQRTRWAYRAKFGENVIIKQNDAQIGSADLMVATFSFENASKRAAATAPAVAPEPKHLNPPTTRHAPRAAPASAPTTQPQKQPVDIFWTGPLTVTPVPMAQSGLSSISDRLIELTGTPVKLDHEGSMIRAAHLRLHDDGNEFIAESSKDVPQVILKDAQGMSLVTPHVDMANNVATFTGESSAEMMQTGADGKPQKLGIAWNKTGVMHIEQGPDGGKTLDHASFTGNVVVNHPQILMRGGQLDLSFRPQPPQAKSRQLQLEELHASDGVTARLTDSQGKIQTIASQDLSLSTEPQADGTLIVREFNASGKVHAEDPQQTLDSDKLQVIIAPVSVSNDSASKSDQIKIEKLIAQGSVNYKAKAGSNASADDLSIVQKDGAQIVTLLGGPATVGDADHALSGKIITIDSTNQNADVAGAGKLVAKTATEGDKPSRPIEVTWTDAMHMRSKDNLAEVLGGVTAVTTGADGATQTATGKRLLVHLENAPATTQSTEATVTAASGPNSAAAVVGGNKRLKGLELLDEVEIKSILLTADGALLQRTHIFAQAVNLNTGTDGQVTDLNVPSGGRMLYDDRRPDNASDATTKPSDLTSMRGAMAMEWKKSMTYRAADNQAIIDGDVVVVHQPPNQDKVTMNCQRLIADIVPAQGANGRATIKQVRADGGATFISKNSRFDAVDCIYDPANNRIIARGTPRNPIQIYDENGLSTGSVEELWWNIKEGRPERMKNVSAEMRK